MASSELTKAAAQAEALKENEARDKAAAEAQAKQDAEQANEVVVAEPDPTAAVELEDEFDDEGAPVVVSVPNYENLELVQGKRYDVPVTQAQLLVETPAVRYAE